MTEKQVKLAVGSLLHDIGKIVYRSGDKRNHSESGYSYLKETAGIRDREILNCVRYHHGKNLRYADLPEDSLVYLTYFADHISAGADRREKENPEDGFDRTVPLDSVFNLLNGNNGKSHYRRTVLDAEGEINYPTEEDVQLESDFYSRVEENITDSLKGIEYREAYVNSLLAVLEANLSYVPSSTSRREISDISLYDHVKLTAALALCMEQYFASIGETDYKAAVWKNEDRTYKSKMFLLYSLDISGIQSFIYTITSEGALKGLRARSFYLEILMEHIVDELLEASDLCRANLIYTGGGHGYLLLPNTGKMQEKIDAFEKGTNRWFMDHFGTALYVAGGAAPCSANDLMNRPEGSYGALYRQISKTISARKAHRYSWEDIRELNSRESKGERECKICRNTDELDDKGRCSLCAALENFSGDVLYSDFFVVQEDPSENALPLPGDRYLTAAESEAKLREAMNKEGYVRCYTKNSNYTGKLLSTYLWVGNYTTGDTFEQLADKAKKSGAIKRIGILRADVDNMGAAFAQGFLKKDGNSQYMTLSRTAVLSRQLSLFFKNYINRILMEGKTNLSGKVAGSRNAVIVYSGGDDLFLVGAWNEIVESYMDIKKAFERFTLGTLTISGGIGIYPPKYPIHVMAKETERLEEKAKGMDGKNAVSLFDPSFTFYWDRFADGVVGEKLSVIQDFFDRTEDYGKAFLYHLLELLEGCTGKNIQFVQLIYLLSRMEPGRDAGIDKKQAYNEFSKNIQQWVQTERDRKEAEAAINLYIYLTREKTGRELE